MHQTMNYMPRTEESGLDFAQGKLAVQKTEGVGREKERERENDRERGSSCSSLFKHTEA